ncbi:MAG TPA: protein kinase [Bryobacteraceae bacterium]|nr:protein kinase [Bryobacteraceae bacterium]
MPLAPGNRLGPYEIVAPIGAGGMGEVYKARDTRLDRTVAIKVGSPQYVSRFEREARAIAALSHPHICALYDIGPDYLVMEYIEGTPLKGPLPADQGLPLALQMAQALEEAHRKGIVHRDLKPSNILVTTAGIKLLDFGLAKQQAQTAAAEATASLTEVGTVVGTVAYMSPEQAEGKPVDPRSDIFSFGLVLYEMLSGHKAFSGETALSTMVAILHQEPRPLEAAPQLARVVERCLRKSPGERFQTMTEVIAALEEAGSAKGSEPAPSIAVLPFANMSADKENEYFSDGLAEEIINALTQVPGLKVTARTSAFSFRGKDVKIADIARELGVAHVLEGSVRKAGNRIRVTAQLIKAADGFHLWSERYDRELTDVFAIQDEISAAIVEQLKLNLTGARAQPMVKRAITNPAAYEAFLEGRHHWYRLTPSSTIKAREFFEKAVSIDPGFAPAHVGLADCFFLIASLGGEQPRNVLPKVAEEARRALELDENCAEAHSMLAVFHLLYEYNWSECERRFRKALVLAPASRHVRFPYVFWYLRAAGRLEEAEQEMDRMLEQDPLAANVHYGKAAVLMLQRRYPAAADCVRRALEIEPNYLVGLIVLAHALAADGRFEGALATAERMGQVYGRWPVVLETLGDVYAMAGRKEDALRVLEELKAFAQRTYVSANAIAALHAQLGENDAAIEWLQKSIHQRDPFVVLLPLYAPYDGLRSDPRYPGLLRQMNLA